MPSRYFPALAALFALCAWMPCHAEPMLLDGQWFSMPSGWVADGQHDSELTPISQPDQTGGRYLYRAEFDIVQDAALVLDFKNSSVINQFYQRIYNSRNQLIAEAEGGIQSSAPNPFFLRHGRELALPAGHYRLYTEISSPFLLAQPVPYLDTQEHYRQAIKPGNAFTLICMGILFGLGFYYAALSTIRNNPTDALYALFILGNLLYNGTALLLFHELFGLHWFYLISIPILFSNCVYILFVTRLLDITRHSAPRLYRSAQILLGLFAAFILLALFKPNWSLELDRLGVALFLSYGLVAGIARARQHHISARRYLFAVIAFFVLGSLALFLSGFENIYTFYIEHLGLLAVTVEVLLLALVLAHQFEQLRAEKERAITDSLDKSRFLAAASHDLRQPMHAMSLFVEELRNEVTTPQQGQLVKLIEESAHAMSGLLDSLLDISKLDAGLVTPCIQPLAIASLLKRMEQEYVPLAAQHEIGLIIRPCAAMIDSDAILLERILLNLLGNAIRYTPQGGRVLLACRKRGQRLRIEVRDNGIGIPLDKQQDIFREFVQLANSERSRDKGLGLGLSIVQRLCRLMACSLQVRSQSGKGSVFAVEVLLSEATAQSMRNISDSERVAAAAATENIRQTQVLILEDDPLVQTGTQRLLASWGYEVQVAANLAQMRQLFPSIAPDLLICDFRLPDGNGIQAIRAAEDYYRKKLPCILVSGETNPEVLKEVKTQGWHLLHKPVKPAKLKSLLLFTLQE